jgi:hypothetical protein
MTAITNTPRPGDTPEQVAARTAPRGQYVPREATPRRADLAFLTNPGPNVYLLNLQFPGPENLRVEISKAQLANILVDGAGMALRGCDSVRLGPEALQPAKPYAEPA